MTGRKVRMNCLGQATVVNTICLWVTVRLPEPEFKRVALNPSCSSFDEPHPSP